jgi:hypothetical protein
MTKKIQNTSNFCILQSFYMKKINEHDKLKFKNNLTYLLN